MDDSYLAVESAKLNVQGENIQHHFNNNLSDFEDETFDLIITNPPFHFEYEINIKIPLQLFKECFRCLKLNGNLQIVANKHLNYLTHLKSIFPTVQILAQNDNFVIYKCAKSRED
ncbi:MAG: methyltransferase [Flavobacteriales bacterium]|nr:methyltransferase [Flavobacteriales bacterium]